MATPLPGAPRGGQALPVSAAPKAGSPGWKAFTAQRWATNHPNAGTPKAPAAPKQTADQAATGNAMAAFHTALAQLQGAVPQVDPTAIYAPYRASEAVAGQLATGMQGSIQQAGQAAQNQYAAGRDLAQQHAAQFGISAGAGANPTQLQDSGTPALAAQTNAYASAAPAAGSAWQALLERTGAAQVNAAQQNRANTIASGTASLSATIPSLIGDAKTRAFQAKTEKFNEGLAKSQLTQKQNAALNSYELGAAKVNTSANTAATSAQIKRDALAEKTATDKAKLKQGAQKIAQGQVKLTAAQTKAAKGLSGVPAAIKALTPAASKGSTTRAAKGFDVTIQPWDFANNKPNGPVTTKHASRADWSPPGYKNVGSTTHYESVPSASVSSGVTPAQWDAQYRSLLGQNPGKGAQIRVALGARPK